MKRVTPLVLFVFVFVALTAVGWAQSTNRVYLPIIAKPVPLPTSTPTRVPTATPTIFAPTATPTAVPTQPPAPTGCTRCDANVYNCTDFSTQAQAQACHDFCMAQVGFDVHRLDANDDGVACESLPDEPLLGLMGGWEFSGR